MSEVGKNVVILRGLEVHSPKGIHIGNNVRIGKDARLSCYNIEGGGKIVISDNCYIGNRFSVLSGASVQICNNVLIASDVAIVSENHGKDCSIGLSYGKQPLVCSPVTISEFSWIGEKVLILPGVTLGKWSIIGGGSVVTKDVPDYCIAVGNPARIIKQYDHRNKKWVPYEY